MTDAQILRHVKIVCTLGPASNSPEVIRKLLSGGMNIARLNLNYGTLEEHSQLVKTVRSLSQELGLTAGVLLDLPGFKRRTGDVKAVFGQHLEFAVTNKADWIALSFISSAQQVKEVRVLLREMKSDIPLIVKIERAKSLEESKSIIEVCDGIMVARGDLAADISIERVPIAQKRLIKEANRAGKPVITATQMLESMTRSITPTRAEATDVANAVLDGSDALMLSEETTIGAHPVEAVETMVKIILAAESELPYGEMFREDWPGVLPEINDATARAACHIAYQVQAKAVVAFTAGGTTALRVSKYRPRQPILAVTPNESVARRLALSWGVSPVIKVAPPTLTGIFELAVSVALDIGIAGKGDLLVITAGIPPTGQGGTNLIKVHRV
ncbi:MAG: pyruvate kinase [Chloroflexi bacterium]|nr:pyruvate kinase [Chloroflexota bacterium]